ncbi:MAG: hypothetical protein OEO23_04700 [Gemmatimonadota bacterium]|nr:hypothetical protein [Gemmatimonadota bacterium]
MTFIRFLVLVVLLNVIRYVVTPLLETPFIFPRLFAAMEASPEYFNQAFSTWDWITSYAYNFVMWGCATWLFHLLRPVLKGGDVTASFKVFGLVWLLFASVSAIYMNHYSHPRNFYGWNILDAFLAFGLVALANGILYRRVMGTAAAAGPA